MLEKRLVQCHTQKPEIEQMFGNGRRSHHHSRGPRSCRSVSRRRSSLVAILGGCWLVLGYSGEVCTVQQRHQSLCVINR